MSTNGVDISFLYDIVQLLYEKLSRDTNHY